MSIQRSDGLETRTKLLAVAGAVFAEQGFHKARTADICRRAGANIAAIHYHFRSKELLYVEAWRHAFERSILAYPPDGGVPDSASAEERLRGRIRALVARSMDPDSIDFDIVHKEMANPTGLLSEVMRRSIDPLRRHFTDVVRVLLGAGASEKQVQLCVMSIDAQCFSLMIHERQHRRACLANGATPESPLQTVEADELADHIFYFSLAGVCGLRRPPERRKKQKTTQKEKA